MTIPTISTLPTAPARTDPPATFVTRADSFLAALVVMQGELNTSIGAMNTDIAGVNADATTASNAATAAAASQAAAEAASNATEWVSGTSYSDGDVVYSPITYLSYRAIQATSGTTDPSTDTANWVGLNVAGGSGEQTFTATGTIATGDLVALNSDGSVSVIAQTIGPPALGDPVSAGTVGAINGEVTACYDPVQDAIFVAYRSTSSGYLEGVVGKVNGTSIDWGSSAVIYSASNNFCDSVYISHSNTIYVVYNHATSFVRVAEITVNGSAKTFTSGGFSIALGGNNYWTRITYDPDTAKAIICSSNIDNNRLEYAFGTISGGFNSGVIYNPAATVRTPDITYDESQDKVLVVFAKETTRYGAAIVGTVGASSITWGSDVTFESTNVTDGQLHLRYDPTSQKSIVAYRLSSTRYANTITISGTTPSFGTKTNTGAGTGQSLNYDSGAGKVIEMYKKSGAPDNDYLYFDTYSVSGTTVVVDSSTALTTSTYSGSDTNRHMEVVYDTNGEIVAVYDDDTNSTLSGIVYDKETISTNAADFIGIAKADISNAASGTIYVNTGISEDQTGLTAQTGYYVNATGGLSATATGYPFVGYATSATGIFIGGKNLPSETGQSGKFLTTDGANLSWAEAGGVQTQSVDVGTSASITFASIPAGIKQIFIGFDDVRLSSETYLRIELGNSGGFITSGYQSTMHRIRSTSISSSSTTSNFSFFSGFGNITQGTAIIQLVDETNDGWALNAKVGSRGNSEHLFSTGSVTLSGEITQLKIYPAANQFAEGIITIQYQ